jgi:hypothetical protein
MQRFAEFAPLIAFGMVLIALLSPASMAGSAARLALAGLVLLAAMVAASSFDRGPVT